MSVIPGEVTEIRYQRTGRLRGAYYHPFKPGVRMHANRDGSVTLRGARKIHATEDEPGFWEKYANPPARRAAARGRGTVAHDSGLWWLLIGVAVAWWSVTRTPAQTMAALTPAPVPDLIASIQAQADAAAAAATPPDPLTLLYAPGWF